MLQEDGSGREAAFVTAISSSSRPALAVVPTVSCLAALSRQLTEAQRARSKAEALIEQGCVAVNLQPMIDRTSAEISGLYDRIPSLPAGSVDHMLLKLRLLMEMAVLSGRDFPALGEAYQPSERDISHRLIISLWADAVRLSSGGIPGEGRPRT